MNRPVHFTVVQPRLPTELKTVKPAEPPRDDDSYSDCLIERCGFPGPARRLSITRARLRNVRFGAALPAAELEDVIFDSCDLSNVDFSDAILLRTVFMNCRMTGVNFGGAVLRDTALENSMAEYANFRFARLDRVSFTGCGCANADFGEASFDRVRLERTDLRQAQMSGTCLTDIDFTSCEIDGLGARPENLRGAIFSADQAVTAAKIIGITIRF